MVAAPKDNTRGLSRRDRAILTNPNFYLQHFNDEARRFWWRRHAPTLHERSVRVRLYLFLHDPSTTAANVVSGMIVGTIVVMQIGLVVRTDLGGWITQLDSAESFARADSGIFSLMIVCNTIFTIELVLSSIALFAPVRLVRSPWLLAQQVAWVIVDLLAVLAFWAQVRLRSGGGNVAFSAGSSNASVAMTPSDTGTEDITNILELVGALRIGRVAHSIARFPDGALLIRTVVASAKALMFSMIWVAVAAFFLGGIIYYAENLFMPNETMFVDYVTAIWFMLVTFTTVGYGDVYPVSFTGRVITVVAIFFAVIFMAMPITIVGNNFQQAWEEREKHRVVMQIQKSMLEHGMGVEEIIGLFARQDTSGDGSLSYVEFKAMLINLGLQVKQQDARRIYNLFDTDGDGSCSYQEFCHIVFPTFEVDALSSKEVQKLAAKARRASNFEVFDLTSDEASSKLSGVSEPAYPSQEMPSTDADESAANGSNREYSRIIFALREETEKNAAASAMQSERILSTLTMIERRLGTLERALGAAVSTQKV